MGFHGDSSMGTPIRDALNDLLVGWLIVVVPISSISCLASGLHFASPPCVSNDVVLR